jgi:hypothetical protein
VRQPQQALRAQTPGDALDLDVVARAHRRHQLGRRGQTHHRAGRRHEGNAEKSDHFRVRVVRA